MRPEERTILEDADGEAYEMMLASFSPGSRSASNSSPEYLWSPVSHLFPIPCLKAPSIHMSNPRFANNQKRLWFS